jgi:hypothetical protein
MEALYFILAAVHVIALVVTGALWTVIDLVPKSGLRPRFRDIRAVHFGSLYLVPWFLGLAYAFRRLNVPPHSFACVQERSRAFARPHPRERMNANESAAAGPGCELNAFTPGPLLRRRPPGGGGGFRP